MDLHQLIIFREVALKQNFTRAAASLNYVQSNVTLQIQRLEDDLGQPLFDRLGKQVVLTDAGQYLLEYAERLLNLAEEAQAVVSTGTTPHGTLKISSSETVCIYRLPALFRAFHALYPGVHLIYRPYAVPELRRQIHDGNLDVAFVLDEPDREGGTGEERLSSEPVWLFSAPDHPLSARPMLGPVDLTGTDIFLTDPGCAHRIIFERILHRANVSPHTFIEFRSVEAVKQHVMSGLGLGILPAMAITSEVEQGRLTKLPWAGPDLSIAIYMVWHKEKWLSPTLSTFLSMSRTISDRWLSPRAMSS